MKQLEVPIMGQAYVLACPQDAQAHMLEAVRRVDEAMSQIRDAGKIRARERIAVLAALNLAYDQVTATPAAPLSAAPAATPPAQQGILQDAPDTPDPSNASAVPALHAVTAPPSEHALIHPRLQALLQRVDALLAQDGLLL